MIKKKAQASFEFLATYGWVLVGVLGAIGLLFYFNVFDPQRYLPEDCEFGQNIRCEDFSIRRVTQGNFDMNIKLKNNLEKPIELVDVTVLDDDNIQLNCPNAELFCPFNSNQVNWTISSPTVFAGKWGVGKSCKLTINCDKFLVADTKTTILVTLKFRRQTILDDAANHTIKGKLFANIQ